MYKDTFGKIARIGKSKEEIYSGEQCINLVDLSRNANIT